MDMTILLAVDNDPISYRAAATVARWLPHDATVVALHVGPTATPLPVGPWPTMAPEAAFGYPYATLATLPTGQELEDMAREVAGRAAGLAEGEPRVEHGDPATVICRVATDIRADLIVVGTSDRSWISRIFRPSVGANVATDAPCSVLVVREPDYKSGDEHQATLTGA
jgi:nucleotide-binding universal stress UspA family protein